MLPKSIIDRINESVEDVYKRIKARFLGKEYQKKGIEFKITNALEEFYKDIAEREGVEEPNEDNIETLKAVAESYLDASKEKAKAQVVNAVQSSIREAVLSGETKGIQTSLEGALTDVWAKATTHVHTILDSEINSTKNISIMDGVVGANAAVGVEDPVVFFVIVRDGNVCKECIRLHMMPDGTTPRLWYLSEVGHGYHKKGEETPKIGGLHPHCRCVMTTLMPGFGFNEGGFVKYISKGYNAIEVQRGGLSKGEMEYIPHDCDYEEDLTKSTRKTLKEGLLKRIMKHVKLIDRTKPPEHLNSSLTAMQYRRAPVVTHIPDHVISHLLSEGRLKTQFDTGGGGSFGPMYRRDMEQNLFGIPHHLEGDYRPIYGTLFTGYSNERDWVAGGDGYHYGDIWLELKPEAKKRSTFTPDDSFGCKRAYQWKDVPEYIPHKEGFNTYLEAQIHGGVYLDKDVRAIHCTNPRQNTKDLLMQLGRQYDVPTYAHYPNHGDGDFEHTEALHEPQDPKKRSFFDRRIKKRVKSSTP